MAEQLEENDDEPITGRAALVYVSGILFTFVGGIVVFDIDKDLLSEERAHRHGDGSDIMLYPILPLTFFAVWIMQMAVAFFVNDRQPRVIRAAPVIVWVLPALWLLMYLVVFRPRG